jgi:hypothetical protein
VESRCRAQAVDADADPHHVDVGVGVPECPTGVGSVDDPRHDPIGRQASGKPQQAVDLLRGEHRIFLGYGQVGPQPL